MRKILVIFSVLALVSCETPQDDRATAVCNCYKLMHRIDVDTELELLNYVADSCQSLHAQVLNELKDQPEEKEKFDKAYEFCQNEK